MNAQLEELIAATRCASPSELRSLESKILALCDGALREIAASYADTNNFADLLQIARVACLQLVRRIPPNVPFFRRMYWVARQVCSTHARSWSSDVHIPEESMRERRSRTPLSKGSFTYTTKHVEVADEQTPEALLMSEQGSVAVRRACNQLPLPERDIVAWSHGIGRAKMSIRAIANERRESFTHVRNALLRGESMLAELLSEERP